MLLPDSLRDRTSAPHKRQYVPFLNAIRVSIVGQLAMSVSQLLLSKFWPYKVLQGPLRSKKVLKEGYLMMDGNLRKERYLREGMKKISERKEI